MCDPWENKDQSRVEFPEFRGKEDRREGLIMEW